MGLEQESNRKQNIDEYEEQNAILKSRPPILFLELTRNCNLSCRMCRTNGKYNPEWDMTSETINQVFAEIVPYVSLVDLRGWGESTILNGFSSILIKTILAGAKVRVVTNGICMTPELWETMFSSDNVVTISVDAASEELFLKLRGGSLSTIVKNIKEGISIRNRLGKGRIYLNAVVSKNNLKELPNILRLGSSLNIDKVVLFPLISKRANRNHLCWAKKEIVPVLEELMNESGGLKTPVQLGASLDESLTIAGSLPSICTHPWSHIYVDYMGDIGFCDHLIGRNGFTLGSLKDCSFEEILNNLKFINLRRAHMEAKYSRILTPEFWPCTWCYHNRYVDFEHELYPSLERKLVSTENSGRLYLTNKERFPIYSFI